MTRARTRLLGAAATAAGRTVRVLPGLAAMACAVVGVWLLFGVGWALLAAVPFLLIFDSKTPAAG